MNAYDQHVARLKNAWQTEDDDHEIVPDGHRVRISIMAMDSVQRAISNQPAIVQHNLEANQATFDTARRNADRVQAFADHLTAQREVDDSAYGKFCQRVSDAWEHTA